MSNPQVPLSGSAGSDGPFPTLGATTITLADADHTLVIPSETGYFYLLVNGTLTAPRDIIAPLVKGFPFIVVNQTVGGHSINIGGITGSGVTVQNGSSVVVATDGVNYTSPTGGAGGAGFSLGMSAVGNSLFVEAGTDWTNIPAAVTQTIFTLLPFVANGGEVVAGSSNLAAGEQVTIAICVDVQNPANDDLAHFEWRMTARSNGATVLNSQGTTVPTEITSPPEPLNEGSSLVGMNATIAVSGTTLTVTVTTLASTPVLAAVSVSYVRRSPSALPPAPTLSATSANNGPAEGGTAFSLTGTNLQYVFGVNIIAPGPTVVPASFSYNSGTGQLDCLSGATSVGGLSTIEVLSPGGTASLPNSWTYNLDSFTIFGPNAHVWKMSGVAQAGGIVTAWNDQNTASPLNLTPVGSPTYNANDPTWTPSQPSVGFNGTSQYFQASPSDIPGDQSMFAWAVVDCSDSSGARNLICYASDAFFDLRFFFGEPQMNGESLARTPATFGTVVVNQPVLVTGFSEDGAVGAGGHSTVAVDNSGTVTTTGAGVSNPAGSAVLVGVRTGGTVFFFVGVAVEFGLAWFPPGSGPTPTQLAQLQAYSQAQYGSAT